MAKTEVKAEPEPDLEVNRLLGAEPAPGTATKTIDVEHALAVMRSENAQLRQAATANAAREAQNRETSQKNREHTQNRILELQDQHLASQDKVSDLQKRLLAMRAIVNEG